MKDWQSNLSLLNWSVLGEDGWVVELSLQKVKGHHEMCTAIHPPTSNTHHPDNLFFFLFFFSSNENILQTSQSSLVLSTLHFSTFVF
jgi:hypothetical protein